MEPRFLVSTKPAWPYYTSSDYSSRIGISVDHTVSDPDFERKYQISMLPQPLNLRFCCRRQKSAIDPRMIHIYQQAVRGLSHLSLSPNATGCAAGKISKHCGNSRGQLFECACETLNRIFYPRLREQYEDKVINTVLHIVKSNPKLQTFNMAIFASGGLHGELVLMIKLIDQLKRIGFEGALELFLIDQQYCDNITQAFYFDPTKYPNGFRFPWSNFLGGREDLAQFLTEISLCLPPTIELRGAVFGDAKGYIDRASKDENFRHDLLIGADIEDAGAIVSQLKQEAQRRNESGIILIKQDNQPKICEAISHSGHFKCTPIAK